MSSQHGLLYQVGKQGQPEPLAEVRSIGRTRDGPCMMWQFLLTQHWHPWQEQQPFRKGMQTALLVGNMGIMLLEGDHMALSFA